MPTCTLSDHLISSIPIRPDLILVHNFPGPGAQPAVRGVLDLKLSLHLALKEILRRLNWPQYSLTAFSTWPSVF